MKSTGQDLLRRLAAKLRKLRALRHERAIAPQTSAAYLLVDPTQADTILAAELGAVMRRSGVAEPEELTVMAERRYLTNADLERLLLALESIDNTLSLAGVTEDSED